MGQDESPSGRADTDARTGLRSPATATRGAGLDVARTASSGLLSALVSISLTVALASLIFGEGLEADLPAGMGVLLMGSAAMAVVGALGSRLPGAIIGPQDGPATVLASVGAALVASGSATAGDTMLTLLVLTSVPVGLVLYLLGRFRLGRLLRFLPFPVMAGFSGGIGLVLLDAGAAQVTDGGRWSQLLAADLLLQWLPAIILAVVLSIQLDRGPSGLRTVPALFAASIAGLHAVRVLAGSDLDRSVERGWFIGPFPDGSLWTPGTLTAVARADWAAVVHHLPTLATILLLVPLHMLLNTGAVEHDLAVDIDLERELRLSGSANLVAAAVGSPPGYLHYSNTLLTSRMVGARRGAGLVVAAATIAVVAVGGRVLSIIPTAVVGGVLLALGASLVLDVLWRTTRQVARPEAAVIVFIAVSIPVLGFLVGIGLGIVAAVALFVVRYSRTPVVRTEMSGRLRRSNVQRSSLQAGVLDTDGDRTLVLELEGFLFFGTAESVLVRIRRRLDQPPALDFVVLDFARVTGVDASAAAVVGRAVRLAGDHSFTIVASDLPARLGTSVLDSIEVAPDLDHALEWCEDRLLGRAGALDERSVDGFRAVFGEAADALRPHFVREVRPAGTPLLTQGQPSPGLFFLERGRASIVVGAGVDGSGRRRHILEGTIVGEIASYLGGDCTATVVLATDGVVGHLDHRSLAVLCEQDPVAAAALHRAVARVLAERVVHADAVIRHLQA